MYRALYARRLVVWLTILVIAVACSVSLKQRAVRTVQTTQVTLAAIQDNERAICDPERAQVRPQVPITTCVESAVKAGLTTERHQNIAKGLAVAFGLQVKAATALQAWQAGQPPPKELDEMLSTLGSVLTVIRQITPATSEVSKVVADIQSISDQITQLINSLKGESK